MSRDAKLGASHLARQAVVYVRQSSMTQVHGNLESQRRQYGLADHARALGFHKVEVIDQDLGRSASGSAERPGFERLVAQVLSGQVGAVLCIEASRLARNGRDWHHLLDLCALCDTLIIDPEGIYDACQSNDRLLLGLKGSVSEFELSLLRQRAGEARKQKAARGELQFNIPVGLQWTPDGHIVLDPDLRVQEALRLVFRKFTELGSVMAVLKWFVTEQIKLPSYKRKHHLLEQHWAIPHYSTLLGLYKNPLYAGAYAYGKSRSRTRIVEHRALKSYGQRKPLSEWSVLLLSHHPGYIPWSEYLRNQQMIKEHTHQDKAVDRKAGRGGQALLAGMVRCRRCGQRMRVHYRSPSIFAYRCHGSNSLRLGTNCLNLSGYHVDERVGAELVQALTPCAIEAALVAAQKQQQARRDVESAVELEREQTRYQVELASRRYDEVDPHNRLVALELERRWEQELSHLEELDRRLEAVRQRPDSVLEPTGEQLFELARDLSAVWNDPHAEPALKQRLASLLLAEVLCDLDAARKEMILVLHWHGGRHSEVRLPQPAQGKHRYQTDPKVRALLSEHGQALSNQELSNLLNQQGLKTGHGGRWDAERVRKFMTVRQIGRYGRPSAVEGGLTLMAAAQRLAISPKEVRRLVDCGLLTGEQRYARARFRIPIAALERPEVEAAVQAIHHHRRAGCPQPQPITHPKAGPPKEGV